MLISLMFDCRSELSNVVVMLSSVSSYRVVVLVPFVSRHLCYACANADHSEFIAVFLLAGKIFVVKSCQSTLSRCVSLRVSFSRK